MSVNAVIFDLDGTITEPMLDFDLIRSEIGFDENGSVLERISDMPAAERQKAQAVLERHENYAAEHSKLNPGIKELLAWLRCRKIKTAVITRNQRVNVLRVLSGNDLIFDAIFAREDGPAKPDPAGVLALCGQLSSAPGDTLVVGDYVFDLLSAKAAGAIPVLITTHKKHADFQHLADFIIDSAENLLEIIDTL